MTEPKPDNKTTLFFVKNTFHPFGLVENFLKKRGYQVVVETDIKIGLDKIMRINPEYIFLAWDHKNTGIRSLSKTIYQSCTGQIVPFITSTQRDQIIQLENSGFESRLYPPLSGPAIVRLIAKNEQRNQFFDQMDQMATAPASAPAKKQSEMIQVKSFFKDEATSSTVSVRSSASTDSGQQKKKALHHRGQAQIFAKKNQQEKLITALSEAVDTTENLYEEQKTVAKKKLKQAVDNEFSKQSGEFNLTQSIEQAVDEIPDYLPEPKAQLKEKLRGLLKHPLDRAFPQLGDDKQGLGDDVTSSKLSVETKKLSKEQTDVLEQSFSESVKPELFDLIETYSDLKGNAALNQTTQIYVLAVQEINWTGYLMVASENYLDVESAQTIFNTWISTHIRTEENDQSLNASEELPESVLFEIRVDEINFSELCSLKADFFKSVEFEDKKTLLGFFAFSPFKVINSIHAQFDMLELSTIFLQPNYHLPFDINLYLAENKKFITYLRADSFLDDTQVSRLQTRKVEFIYSNLDHELALLKYKAEFNVKTLIEDYKRIKGLQK